MFLKGLSLQAFRNYSHQTFLFKKPLTIILAPNASGKTNILESIHLLSTGQSFRSGTIDDFIQIDQEFGRIKSKVLSQNEDKELELLLTKGLVNGKRTAKKIFSLNEVRKTAKSVLGLLPTVSFIPEDLRLITGSPSRRREFLNTSLIQLDPQYAQSLTTYDQTLRRRNKLLQQIREGETSPTVLSFWNQSLIKHGEYLQEKRRWFIDHLNALDFPLHFQVEYDVSVISTERLQKYASAEVASGHTLVGPHKDDIIVKFQVSNKISAVKNQLFPLFTHGSRGQQRMGVLWLKLGVFELLSTKNQEPPLLLLDDIFSELDIDNRQRVLDLVKKTQTILTSAEDDILSLPELREADIIRI